MIGRSDKYVEYAIKKFKHYQYNIKLFMKDELIGQCYYVEQFYVNKGEFKGYHYWGQLFGDQKSFRPHGFGMLINLKDKILQMGTFKTGKEYGQQRIIQSYPLKERQITIFTVINAKLNGPALLEKANGTVETGSYLNDLQVGEWKHRFINGKVETVFYVKGKPQNKEQLQAML